MRGRVSAVVAVLAVTASLVVASAGSASAQGCDTQPIQTALTALKNVGPPGIAVTVKSPRCGVWNGGVGVADRATGRKVIGNEHSRIGSDTKTWTSVVVLQLVGEGKIKLDGKVDDYLPGLIRNASYDGRKITIRQLLQHTSGLPDYLDDDDFWGGDPDAHRWEHIEPLFTVQQALKLDPPEQTDTGFAYSNTNYNLLGLIVQKVTGRPIATEIDARISKPLGLRETYWPGDDTTVRKPDLRTYEKRKRTLVDRTEWNVSEADASGELISTGADATGFWTALMCGKLLKPAQLAALKTTIVDDLGQGYGLGIERYQYPGFVAWGHSGLMEGGATFRNAVTDNGQRAITLLIDRPMSDAESNKVQKIMGNLIRDIR